MRRSRVEVGAEQGKGSSVLMGRPGPGTRQGTYDILDKGASVNTRVNTRVQNPKVTGASADDKIFDFDGDVIMTDASSVQDLIMSPMPIDQVDPNIFIGDVNGAENISVLRNNHITHIINTAGELPNFFAQNKKPGGDPEFHYLNLGLQDNPTHGEEDLLEVLEPSYRYIMGVLKRNRNAHIFIHCHLGRSRSASIVLYYLMRSKSWSFEQSLDYLKRARWIVSPNPWYTKQLKDVSEHLSKNI
jgi:hypothetical protein